MAKDQPITVKDAVHKLQLSLLDGIQDENQLFAAGSLMSQSDYEHVVTERSIANLCGYPLCSNALPAECPRKGRYRISLKEHKVYDLHETYKYCSSSCVVNSQAFAGSLHEERCSVLNPAKIEEILRLFGDLSLESKAVFGESEDLEFSRLKIREKTETKAGEVPFKDWIGPSNAIEGFVPQGDRTSKHLYSKNHKGGSKSNHSRPDSGKSLVFNEMDFMSAIITEDEYSISKTSSGLSKTASNSRSRESKGKGIPKDMEHQFTILETASAPVQNGSERKLKELKLERSSLVTKDALSIPEVSLKPCQNGSDVNAMEAKVESHAGKEYQNGKTGLKSSLKSSGVKKLMHSVTWADEKVDSMGNKNLCEIRELEHAKENPDRLGSVVKEDDNLLRFASAEACAMALSQAAEAVASGEHAVCDAVSEAGIIILPHPHDVDERDSLEDVDMLEPEPEAVPVKWPKKPGISHADIFNSQDSWYDTPPEGFNLTLSPFATMWNSLFAWITSSSLAYIYGRDESFHEGYSLVNGREYPRKIVLSDGRSSEIKQTLASCLARAMPGLAADLRLPTPISILEQGVGHLLETMSFTEALPSLRTKQWQVVALLFIDALSVCRIPALTPHMTSTRMLLHKVLNGALVGVEEYEIMKDLIIPLGRAPQFSAQSGG